MPRVRNIDGHLQKQADALPVGASGMGNNWVVKAHWTLGGRKREMKARLSIVR